MPISNSMIPLRPRDWFKLAMFAAACLMFSAQAQAPGDVRVALVIGNAAYAGDAALVNPVNDAKAMAAVLRKLGFDVVLLQDAGRAEMAEAVSKARDSLKGKQAILMMYFAGHGLQLDWRNYMVPVDAKLRVVADVPQQTLELGTVIAAFKEAGNRLNIVVLDACRNNPFAGLASAGGLAQLDAPPGTFLAYATAPGNIADDGDEKSGNGLYTQFLLAELARPTASIEDVFKRARLNVRRQSQGRQVPAEYTNLEEEFYFDKGRAKPDEAARLAMFNAQKAAWENIKSSSNPNDLYAFLLAFPRGELAENAQFKLDQLAKPSIVAALGQGQSAALGWSGERLRIGDEYRFTVKDGMTGVLVDSPVSTVTAIKDDLVEINGGRTVLTLLAAQVRNSFGSYDPPFAGQPAEYQIGKEWEVRSTQNTSDGRIVNLRGKARVLARETITVPAGTFQTYLSETTWFATNGSSYRLKTWTDPRYGLAIRREEVARNNTGRIFRHEIREMASIKAERG